MIQLIFVKFILFFLIIFLIWQVSDFTIITIIWTWFLFSLIFMIDSRFTGLISLNVLIYIPFYLIIKDNFFAENLAIYSYYLLIMTVVLNIQEFMILRNSKTLND